MILSGGRAHRLRVSCPTNTEEKLHHPQLFPKSGSRILAEDERKGFVHSSEDLRETFACPPSLET